MMAFFAKLDSDNNVINKFVVDQSDVDANGGDQSVEAENWVKTNLLKDDSVIIKQYSNDNSFRANEAEIGGYYDTINNVFITVNIFPSWSLNSNFQWEAPVPKPDSFTDSVNPAHICMPAWEEENQQWVVFDSNLDKLAWNPSTSVWE